jgi:type VI secretion system protein ImpG
LPLRTCYPTEVLPLDLAALNYSVKGDGSLLSLRLEMSADGHLGELELSNCACTLPSATSARCST